LFITFKLPFIQIIQFLISLKKLELFEPWRPVGAGGAPGDGSRAVGQAAA
jgi:hypothetical protein